MTLTPVTIDRFAGLDLITDPEDLGASFAADMLNIEIPRAPGRVGCRAGVTRLGTGTASYHKIGAASAGALQLVRNTGSALQAASVVTSTGTVSAAATTWGTSATRGTSITPIIVAGGAVILSRTGAANELAKDSTGATIAALGGPRYMAITPWDKRTALAHFTSAGSTPSGANGSTTTVFFSDPDAPSTYGANNWISLFPNDGDEITGMVAWRDMLFVIKRQQLFIFNGTSTDNTGNPVFPFRTVSLPSRARVTTNGGGENMVAGSDGVYLFLQNGVYRTTGGDPLFVSQPITPAFDGTGPSSIILPTTGDWSLSYAANRVYVTYTVSGGGSFRSLILDTTAGMWLLWDLSAGQSAQPTNAFEWFDTNSTPTVWYAAGAKILRLDATATSDDATAIPWSYTSGYFAPANDKRVKLFGSSVFGTGTVTLQMLAQGARTADVADPGGSVTLGTAPTVAEGKRRRGVRGVQFAHKLSGSGPASVNRITHRVLQPEFDT